MLAYRYRHLLRRELHAAMFEKAPGEGLPFNQNSAQQAGAGMFWDECPEV